MSKKLTTYRYAWIQYKKSDDYIDSSAILKSKGIQQPYRDNILMCAFAAGWNATGKKITRKKNNHENSI